MNYCKYVDLFYMNDEINSLSTQELASKWPYTEAQCFFTVPHCALPFGKNIAVPYNGRYPCGETKKICDENVAKGFSHIYYSADPKTQYYCDYALVIPFYGDIKNTDKYHKLTDETAMPGYYSATMDDIYCELTVSKNAVYHHYFFENANGRVAVDFSNGGLKKMLGKEFCSIPKDVRMELNASGEVLASCIYQGIKLYFCVSVEGVDVKSSLFENNKVADGTTLTPLDGKYGAVYDFSGDSVIVKVGCSALSYDEAKANVRESIQSFDYTMNKAYDRWNKFLSVVHIECEDEELKRKFYSAMYYSLIKPVYMTGENILDMAYNCANASENKKNPETNTLCTLCSSFMWDVLGISPVIGQNHVLLETPFVQRAKLNLSSKRTLEIIKSGSGKYVKKIIFNGEDVKNHTIPLSELINGGLIEFITED